MSCTGLLGGTFNPPHNGHVLLAATAKKRFDTVGVESTEETRRAYREMLFTTPGIELM